MPEIPAEAAKTPNVSGASLDWHRRIQGSWEAMTGEGVRLVAIWLTETEHVFPAGWAYIAVVPGRRTAIHDPENRRLPTLGAVEHEAATRIKEVCGA